MVSRFPSQATAETSSRTCAREWLCSARTRDPETGETRPAPADQHLCPVDQAVMTRCLAELPGMYARLLYLVTHPQRRTGRAVRVPPSSRVLVGVEADALARLASNLLGTWAGRVRLVPQLSLTRHAYPHGSADQVAADCRVLALHPGPLLALPPGPVVRTWTYPPGRRTASVLSPVPCARCGLPVSPSPSGKRWWPAVCTHPLTVVTGYREHPDGTVTPSAWGCSACSAPLPRDRRPAPPCAHLPARSVPLVTSGMPAHLEDEIGDLEVVYAGDGWVSCLTDLGGREAGLDVLDLHSAAVRLLQENPAPREWLDGVQCRRLGCDSYALFRAPLPAGPEKDGEEPPFSQCADCGDVMTLREYRSWTVLGAGGVKYAAPQACRRCRNGTCGECSWGACACAEGPHPRRPVRPAG